jgi:hypothetical protein
MAKLKQVSGSQFEVKTEDNGRMLLDINSDVAVYCANGAVRVKLSRGQAVIGREAWIKLLEVASKIVQADTELEDGSHDEARKADLEAQAINKAAYKAKAKGESSPEPKRRAKIG